MSNRHKREKFLKVVKQNIIKQEIGEYEKEESPVVWQATSANVFEADFSGAVMSDSLRKILKQQGAIVD